MRFFFLLFCGTVSNSLYQIFNGSNINAARGLYEPKFSETGAARPTEKGFSPVGRFNGPVGRNFIGPERYKS